MSVSDAGKLHNVSNDWAAICHTQQLRSTGLDLGQGQPGQEGALKGLHHCKYKNIHNIKPMRETNHILMQISCSFDYDEGNYGETA